MASTNKRRAVTHNIPSDNTQKIYTSSVSSFSGIQNTKSTIEMAPGALKDACNVYADEDYRIVTRPRLSGVLVPTLDITVIQSVSVKDQVYGIVQTADSTYRLAKLFPEISVTDYEVTSESKMFVIGSDIYVTHTETEFGLSIFRTSDGSFAGISDNAYIPVLYTDENGNYIPVDSYGNPSEPLNVFSSKYRNGEFYRFTTDEPSEPVDLRKRSQTYVSSTAGSTSPYSRPTGMSVTTLEIAVTSDVSITVDGVNDSGIYCRVTKTPDGIWSSNTSTSSFTDGNGHYTSDTKFYRDDVKILEILDNASYTSSDTYVVTLLTTYGVAFVTVVIDRTNRNVSLSTKAKMITVTDDSQIDYYYLSDVLTSKASDGYRWFATRRSRRSGLFSTTISGNLTRMKLTIDPSTKTVTHSISVDTSVAEQNYDLVVDKILPDLFSTTTLFVMRHWGNLSVPPQYSSITYAAQNLSSAGWTCAPIKIPEYNTSGTLNTPAIQRNIGVTAVATRTPSNPVCLVRNYTTGICYSVIFSEITYNTDDAVFVPACTLHDVYNSGSYWTTKDINGYDEITYRGTTAGNIATIVRTNSEFLYVKYDVTITKVVDETSTDYVYHIDGLFNVPTGTARPCHTEVASAGVPATLQFGTSVLYLAVSELELYGTTGTNGTAVYDSIEVVDITLGSEIYSKWLTSREAMSSIDGVYAMNNMLVFTDDGSFAYSKTYDNSFVDPYTIEHLHSSGDKILDMIVISPTAALVLSTLSVYWLLGSGEATLTNLKPVISQFEIHGHKPNSFARRALDDAITLMTDDGIVMFTDSSEVTETAKNISNITSSCFAKYNDFLKNEVDRFTYRDKWFNIYAVVLSFRTKIMLRDARTSAWWYWELPVAISSLFRVDGKLYAVAKNAVVYELTNENKMVAETGAGRFDDETVRMTFTDDAAVPTVTKTKVQWFLQSHPMSLGILTKNKNMRNVVLALYPDEAINNFRMRLDFEVYTKSFIDDKPYYSTEDIRELKTLFLRTYIPKFQYISYRMYSTGDNYAYEKLTLSSISFEYRVLDRLN